MPVLKGGSQAPSPLTGRGAVLPDWCERHERTRERATAFIFLRKIKEWGGDQAGGGL